MIDYRALTEHYTRCLTSPTWQPKREDIDRLNTALCDSFRTPPRIDLAIKTAFLDGLITSSETALQLYEKCRLPMVVAFDLVKYWDVLKVKEIREQS